MKIFFYKTLFIAFSFFIVFKLTIGSLIKEVENKIYESISKENIELIKKDIREQIVIAVKKDNFINKDDADLVNAFIDKIKQDLNKQK